MLVSYSKKVPISFLIALEEVYWSPQGHHTQYYIIEAAIKTSKGITHLS